MADITDFARARACVDWNFYSFSVRTFGRRTNVMKIFDQQPFCELNVEFRISKLFKYSTHRARSLFRTRYSRQQWSFAVVPEFDFEKKIQTTFLPPKLPIKPSPRRDGHAEVFAANGSRTFSRPARIAGAGRGSTGACCARRRRPTVTASHIYERIDALIKQSDCHLHHNGRQRILSACTCTRAHAARMYNMHTNHNNITTTCIILL